MEETIFLEKPQVYITPAENYHKLLEEVNKPTIICLVGASGSGKTALSLHLDQHYYIHNICSYTTRPMRTGETNNVEHKFVTDIDYINETPDNILAYTLYGGYHYWTTHSQVRPGFNVYVIDKRGLDEFKNKWSDKYDIISVLIERSDRDDIDEERKLRDIENPTAGEYDIVITNNQKSLIEFFDHAVDKIMEFLDTM